MHIEIHDSEDGQFYFKILRNGNVTATSETYSRKEKAKQAAEGIIHGTWNKRPLKDKTVRKKHVKPIDGGEAEEIEANEAAGYNQTQGL